MAKDSVNANGIDIVRTLDEVGFEGAATPDHVPKVEGDDDWRHRARRFTVGYLRGVIDVVRDE